MDENIHCCNICGIELDWNDAIWISSSFGVCEKCYNDIPDEVKDDISEDDYTVNTVAWLDMAGANY